MKSISFDIKKNVSKIEFDPLTRDSLLVSAIIHLTAVLIILVNPYLSDATKKDIALNSERTIIIDLQDVSVTDDTNLPPPPPVLDEETKKFFTPETSTGPAMSEKDVLDEKTKPEETVQEDGFSSILDDKEKNKAQKKAKNSDLSADRVGSIDDLLASVEGIKRTVQNQNKVKLPEDVKEKIKNEKQVEREDIKAKAFSLSSVRRKFQSGLSISKLDALRVKLRNCWNVDPGAKGIQDMIIVIRTILNPDGSVNPSNIKVLDRSRYNSDPSFRAVADSAKRAIRMCSPFDLPPSKYQDWKDAVFTFNPTSGSIE